MKTTSAIGRAFVAMAACVLFACGGGGDGGGGGGGGGASGDGGGGVGNAASLANAKVFVGISGPAIVGYDESGKKLGKVELETSATILESDASSVWFLNAGLLADQAIYRFDPASGKVDTITVPDETNPMDISLGEGAVWTVTGKNQLLRVDPATRSLTDTIELLTTDVSTIDDYMRVSAGLGAVWVTSLFGNDENLLKVDPATKTKLKGIPVGDGESGVAAGEGAVFVTLRFDQNVAKIDPSTVQVIGTVNLGGDLGGSSNNIAIGFGSVWVLEFTSNHLKRVDPGAMTIAADIDLGGVPDAVAIGKSMVWVLLGEDKKLLRIDPGSNGIASTVTLDDTGFGLTVRP